MIFEMITGDIATFGVIYVIVITAFGQGRKKKPIKWRRLMI
jgi:hypothetical protein